VPDATPNGPWGWIGHPQRPNRIFLKKICLAIWGGRTTPRATVWLWGGFGHPRPAGQGGRSHPQGQIVALGGGPATPRVILKNKNKKYYFIIYFLKY
jgi:hypothetical protein